MAARSVRRTSVPGFVRHHNSRQRGDRPVLLRGFRAAPGSGNAAFCAMIGSIGILLIERLRPLFPSQAGGIAIRHILHMPVNARRFATPSVIRAWRR